MAKPDLDREMKSFFGENEVSRFFCCWERDRVLLIGLCANCFNLMFKIQQACELASQFDSRLQTFMD